MTKFVPLLHTVASICHALRSSCAERETAILNLADKNSSDKAVRSDRGDSRRLQENGERRDWQMRPHLANKRPQLAKRNQSWRIFFSKIYSCGIKPRRSQTSMLLAKSSVTKRSIGKGKRGRGARAQWARCLIWLNKPLQPISMLKFLRTDRRRDEQGPHLIQN